MTRTRSRYICPLRLLAIAFSVLLAITTDALGVTLDAYKAKAEAARLQAIYTEDLIAADQLDRPAAQAFADHIRMNFPPSETVDWTGGSIETSNEWLLEKVSQFEKETDADSRRDLVAQMREYFSTLVFKMQELQGVAGSERTKDEDKQKLAEILRREEYQKPKPKDESAFSSWLARFLEWLEKLFEPAERTGSARRLGGLGSIVRVVIYVALFAIIGFLLYKLVPIIAGRRRPAKRTKKKDRMILGEKIADDDTAVDLLAEAERLANEGNLRAAIRKGYIALLCELSDRKVLGLARHKTNRDYLRDVRGRTGLHPRMKVVTDTFERHWYGYQQSADNDWLQFRDEYDQTLRSI